MQILADQTAVAEHFFHALFKLGVQRNIGKRSDFDVFRRLNLLGLGSCENRIFRRLRLFIAACSGGTFAAEQLLHRLKKVILQTHLNFPLNFASFDRNSADQRDHAQNRPAVLAKVGAGDFM